MEMVSGLPRSAGPGGAWFFRRYGGQQAEFEKSWRLNDLVKIDWTIGGHSMERRVKM